MRYKLCTYLLTYLLTNRSHARNTHSFFIIIIMVARRQRW